MVNYFLVKYFICRRQPTDELKPCCYKGLLSFATGEVTIRNLLEPGDTLYCFIQDDSTQLTLQYFVTIKEKRDYDYYFLRPNFSNRPDYKKESKLEKTIIKCPVLLSRNYIYFGKQGIQLSVSKLPILHHYVYHRFQSINKITDPPLEREVDSMHQLLAETRKHRKPLKSRISFQ